MKLDIQQANLPSLHPMICVLLVDTWQIGLPMMHQTSSMSTSQQFLWIPSSVHFKEKVLDLIFTAHIRKMTFGPKAT